MATMSETTHQRRHFLYSGSACVPTVSRASRLRSCAASAFSFSLRSLSFCFLRARSVVMDTDAAAGLTSFAELADLRVLPLGRS